METGIFFLLALFSCTYAQYMTTWGSSSGYSNQMQMPVPMPYMHMPYHHVGAMREATVDTIPYTTKTEGLLPFHMIRAKVPTRVGLQDYSVFNVNAPDHEDISDHIIYKQTVSDMKRPVMGVISLFQSPVPLPLSSVPSTSMGSTGTKSIPGFQDSSALDELMTCVGMDMNEPVKIHSPDARVLLGRGLPYYMSSSMHKIKQ